MDLEVERKFFIGGVDSRIIITKNRKGDHPGVTYRLRRKLPTTTQ